MVTLRRDVAAASGNKVFDKKDRDCGEPTAYDLFMEKKRQKSYFCDYVPATTSLSEARGAAPVEEKQEKRDPLAIIFNRAPEKENTEPQRDKTTDEYKSYLIEQLNRKEPKELLTKERFYKVRESEGQPEAAAVSVKSVNRRLSKNGKIFIAVYVLVVAIVASIILAVNSASVPERVDASASAGVLGIVAPMDVPSDAPSEPSNWFDKLLDGLSNG